MPGGFRLTYPEGGEVRLEISERAPGQAELLTAAEAHFFECQQPLSRQIFGDVIPLDEGHELPDSSFCLDGTAGTHWATGRWQQNQAIYDTRDYFDAGDWVRLSPRGGGDAIQLNPSSPDDGEFGGVSNAQGLVHDLIYLPDDPTLEDPEAYASLQNSWVDIDIAGSAALAELTPTNGVNFVSELPREDFALFFPSRFEMVGPAPDDAELANAFEEGFFDRGVAYIEGEDRTHHLPVTTDPDDGDPATAYFASFYNQDGGVHTYCINLNVAEEGTVTVPYEVVAELPEENSESGEPTGVRRGRHSLSHVAHFGYIHDERQLHVLGVASKSSSQGWCAFDSADGADAEFSQFCPEGYWD